MLNGREASRETRRLSLLTPVCSNILAASLQVFFPFTICHPLLSWMPHGGYVFRLNYLLFLESYRLYRVMIDSYCLRLLAPSAAVRRKYFPKEKKYCTPYEIFIPKFMTVWFYSIFYWRGGPIICKAIRYWSDRLVLNAKRTVNWESRAFYLLVSKLCLLRERKFQDFLDKVDRQLDVYLFNFFVYYCLYLATRQFCMDEVKRYAVFVTQAIKESVMETANHFQYGSSWPVKFYFCLLHVLLLSLVFYIFLKSRKKDKDEKSIRRRGTRTFTKDNRAVTSETCQWLNSTLAWLYLHSDSKNTPDLVKLWIRNLNRELYKTRKVSLN